jgi:hypothetical protein
MRSGSFAGLVAVIALSGCAASAPVPLHSTADLGAWVAADEGAPRQPVSLEAATRATALSAREPVTIHARAADPSRPRRSARVDVNLQQAEMTHAFQFLADAGHFNLVVQEGLNARVSATMRGVDPYDALLTLAEANGADVRFERDVVVVRKR